MARSVRSNEPIKATIVALLKSLTGCSKVTLVKEIGPNLYQAHCIKTKTNGAKGTSMGYFKLDLGSPTGPKFERIADYFN